MMRNCQVDVKWAENNENKIILKEMFQHNTIKNKIETKIKMKNK